MKKSTLRRFLLLCLCLTLVTVSLIGGTLAKYTTNVTGSGSATTASWSFTANNQSTTFTDLAMAINSTHNTTEIQPGTSGTVTIVLSNTSDVAADYTVVFSTDNKPSGMTFSLPTNETDYTLTLSDDGKTVTVTSVNALAATNGTKNVVINWSWPYAATAENSDADMTMTLSATVTGTQKAPDNAIQPTN